MLTLEHPVLRLGELLAEKKKPEADVNQDPMLGKFICEDKLILLTMVIPFLWHKE